MKRPGQNALAFSDEWGEKVRSIPRIFTTASICIHMLNPSGFSWGDGSCSTIANSTVTLDIFIAFRIAYFVKSSTASPALSTVSFAASAASPANSPACSVSDWDSSPAGAASSAAVSVASEGWSIALSGASPPLPQLNEKTSKHRIPKYTNIFFIVPLSFKYIDFSY
jgi:hypothetical protein